MKRIRLYWQTLFPPRYSYEQLMRVFTAGQQMGFIEGYEAGKNARLSETAMQALQRIFEPQK